MPEEYISVEFTSHEQYLQILKKLESETAYIAIVQINGEDEQEELLVKAFKYMELAEKRYVKKWLGTVRSGKGAPQYLFKADKRFFKVLREFPSFFFNSKAAMRLWKRPLVKMILRFLIHTKKLCSLLLPTKDMQI